MTDVLIAGAGPAGASLAIHLARQGRSVVLLDRSTFPREKACGEGVMPAGVAALARLGVSVNGLPFHGVRYHHADQMAEGRFPNGAMGLAVRRWHLDAALVDAARDAGAEVVTEARVDGPLLDGSRIAGVAADGREYRAQLTVAADGANSLLRHKLGWDASRPSRRHGIRRHYRGILHPWVNVYLEPQREVYVTPLPNNEVLIATLGDARGELPLALRDLEPIDAPLGAAPLVVRARQRVAPGCALLGDAAGNCDPITGGGIAQALLSAELLAAHLRDDFPPSIETLLAFDRAREALLANYRRLTAGVLALAEHPVLIRPALAVLDRSPWLFSKLLGVAGGVA